MPAPRRNQNASKGQRSRAGSLVQLRVRPADKARWRRAARAWAREHGITASPLTAWIISRLNLAAKSVTDASAKLKALLPSA